MRHTTLTVYLDLDGPEDPAQPGMMTLGERDQALLELRGVYLHEEGELACFDAPARWVLCRRCSGDGTHTNPSIDGPDPEFMEDYMSGVYDIRCEECEGSGKVAVANRRAVPELFLERLVRDERDRAEYEAECAAERRMGA